MGAPPARGAWRHLNLRLLVPPAVLAVAVGWAIPLLGWTLLGFLVLDAALAVRRRLA